MVKGKKKRSQEQSNAATKEDADFPRAEREPYGLKCKIALGGVVPYAPKQVTKVFGLQQKKEELNRGLGEFHSRLKSLLPQQAELDVDIDVRDLCVPLLQSHNTAAGQQTQQQTECGSTSADVSQRSAAGGGQLTHQQQGMLQNINHTASGSRMATEDQQHHQQGMPLLLHSRQTLEQLKKTRQQHMEEAAKHLASVAEVVARGKHKQLSVRTTLDTMNANRTAAHGTITKQGDAQNIPDRLPLDEMVLHVVVHNPEVPEKVLFHFLVASSTKLSTLRDRIDCVSDTNMKNLNAWVPSSYFYFEGVFYIDQRQEGCIDYSEPLRAFCLQHGIKPPGGAVHFAGDKVKIDDSGFGMGDMDDITFAEVGVQLHGPKGKYLYVHQGCCEHCITFRGLRALHPDDPQSSSAYPALFRMPLSRVRNCLICVLRPASWVTYDDKFVAENPCFWCQECYSMMHLDHSGKPRDEKILVLPYVHE